MKLLLVDGSNILLRCAFGGDIPPERSTPTAMGMIDRAARELEATHLVIALDYTDGPSWRKLEYSDYKAHRTVSTAAWLVHGAGEMSKRGWSVQLSSGFEADDIIATLASRAVERAAVVVYSNDSDMLALATDNIQVARPVNGGGLRVFSAADVCSEYEIPVAHALYDFKAMVGESGDNIPGVPGIGPKRAVSLLRKFGDLEKIIVAGSGGYDKHSELVATHADAARRALRLVTLRTDVPIPPITPGTCVFRRSPAA